MRLTIFLLAVIQFCHTFAGTKLPAKCEAGLPSVFLKKMVKESEIEEFQRSGIWGQDQKMNKYWTVYSDRCNNATFSMPSFKSKQFGELDFNEQVRIAKIENDFALVYINTLSRHLCVQTAAMMASVCKWRLPGMLIKKILLQA